MTHQGKVAVVTGATAGIGLETARGLARLGFTVVLVGRDSGRLERSAAGIKAQTQAAELITERADLSLVSGCLELGARLASSFPEIHVLVNNVGAVYPERAVTSEGYERTWALNYLGPVALTNALLPALQMASHARLVNVSSQVHADSLDFGNLNGERSYTGLDAYRRSKLANILFTQEFVRRLRWTGISANSLHPGVVDTGLLDDYETAGEVGRPPQSAAGLTAAAKGIFSRLRPTIRPEKKDRSWAISPELGARTSIFLASSPTVDGVSGKYFIDSRVAVEKNVANDPEIAARLWEQTSSQLKLRWPEAPSA